jgi:DNA topoisomerase I
MKILFVVESPGKINKISGFLGNNYIVKASVGHFRDLDPKKMSIDFENHFEPIYIITKADVVKNLKESMKKADLLYIATDLDREGEGIAQHIYDVLKPKQYKRLKFDSITKASILAAIKDAGEIDENLVDAQKARRILDRLYGYLISPLLRKHLGGDLSAGRVQSPTVELVIDRENEINEFLGENSDKSFFKIRGTFDKIKSTLYESTDKNAHKIKTGVELKGKTAQIALIHSDNPHSKVIIFLKRCLRSTFKIHFVGDKIATRSPAPPFTTSTLQQEANRKLSMPIDATMSTAQKLYEGGFITYMRTDSVEISEEGHKEIKQVIEKEYGTDFYQYKKYLNKSAGAQEAHECIRPVHPEVLNLDEEGGIDQYQIKLYKLIWRRTIASQMKPAKINVTTIQITISKYIEGELEPFYYFQSQLEQVIFPGFMSVYVESVDDPEDQDIIVDFKGAVPKPNKLVAMEEITAKQEFPRPPPRYTQASLVKKLEENGIGRPSTYVNTIKTIMTRDYVQIGNIPGIKKSITNFSIQSENGKYDMNIYEEKNVILLGKENKKLIPTELGKSVNEYLLKNFPEMMDYKFTAGMEKQLDDIAVGKKIWYQVVQHFYDKLNPIVEKLSKEKSIAASTEKLLGKDPDGNEIFAVKTKWGPRVKKTLGKQTIYAKIEEPNTLENITLKEAIKLFDYPKVLGQYKNMDVLLCKKNSYFIKYNKELYFLPKDTNQDIDLETAIREINKIKIFTLKEGTKVVKVKILDIGKGPYLQATRGKIVKNYPIPPGTDTANLTDEQVLQLISIKAKPKKASANGATGGKRTKKLVTKKLKK